MTALGKCTVVAKIYTMTIEQAQKTVDDWIQTIGIRYFSELTNTAILAEEVGEVARLMSRLYGEQSFKTPEQAATAPAELADELADVLFVVICLANQTGVNLTEAFQKNLEKKTNRDANRHANNEKLSTPA
jgi:NTP pyrophosphatase (non-canonical NTP hydrolase)